MQPRVTHGIEDSLVPMKVHNEFCVSQTVVRQLGVIYTAWHFAKHGTLYTLIVCIKMAESTVKLF